MIVKKRVCVIGAGPSGIVAVKELKEQNIEVKCFESQNSIGGAFRSTKEGGRSYTSLKLTVSNYFMTFSDFIPQNLKERKYWDVYEYRNYLLEYVKKFNLKESIYLSHKVDGTSIKNGKVIVEYSFNRKKYTEIFDNLIICSGSNFKPKTLDYHNQSVFEGQILHSSKYTTATQFKGKKVVCVGLGESGADIVHEISQETTCTVLVREYPNVIPRWINGDTNDAYTANCLYAMTKIGIDRYMKFKAWYYLKFSKRLNDTDRLLQEWVRKRKSFMGKFLTKNDVFVKDILNGRVELVKDRIESFTNSGVITSSGKKINADVVVFNTGYQTSFEEHAYGKDFENPRKLFKHMIHPKYGSLVSLIGWARPSQGGLPACSEMQARYMAKLIADKEKLMTVSQMNAAIKKDRRYNESLFDESLNIKSLVCYNNFMTGMGELLECSPKLIHWKDLKLTTRMIFGSQIAAFYRLPNTYSKDTIKSLPIAYSKRRSIVILVMILIHNPKYYIKMLFNNRHYSSTVS